MKASDILHRASELLTGSRQDAHGDARRTHRNIAVMWNAFLEIRRHPANPLAESDVADMMELLKLARRQNGERNVDNAIDGAAYAAFSGEFMDDE